MLALFAEVPMM